MQGINSDILTAGFFNHFFKFLRSKHNIAVAISPIEAVELLAKVFFHLKLYHIIISILDLYGSSIIASSHGQVVNQRTHN
jgi:hypothetical protein